MLANTDADPGVSRNGNGAAVQSKGLSESPARQLSHVGVTNGAPKLGAFTNGSSNTKASANNTTYAGLRRDDVTRMFMQGLKDFGYSEAAHSVSRESGLDLESTGVASFRTAILAGSWAEAEELLGAHGAGGNGLALAPGSDRNLMRFWLRQQKFLELLERRDTTGALMVLRNDLTPLYHDTPRLYSDKSRLRFLSSLLMCKTPQDVKAKASWDGAEGESRKLLLAELLKCVSPSHMMTDSRLVSVLQQVQQGWIDKCLYHTDPSPPSLLYDHTCDRQRFPTKVALELTGIGEVWQVQFSHDGSKLAACGGSRVVRIWETKTFSLIAALGGHDPKGVGNLSWSPDDSLLVTCCQEKYARLWNVKNGNLVKTMGQFEEPPTACAWAADSRSFVVGTLDKINGLRTFKVDGDDEVMGEQALKWVPRHRVQDMCVSANGRWLVAADDQHMVHVYNGLTRELEYDLELKERPTSVSMSQDSRHLLINKKNDELELIDLASRRSIRRFYGHKGGDYMIRSAFGGAHESFVMSGSEDGSIFIWHKMMGAVVERLEGHKPRCNAVSWNPADASMFASGGDDGSVKIWVDEARRADLHAAHHEALQTLDGGVSTSEDI